MDRETFEKKFFGKEKLYGTIICIGDPTVTEAAALAGTDVLWIDMEHSPISGLAVQNSLIAARAGNSVAFVRIPWNDPVLAKPVLDMGPDGVIFPFIRTVADAEAAVAACSYPPKGVRGCGPMRAAEYGGIPLTEYIENHSRKCLRILQIEHIDAVNALEEIVKVDGIDGFIFGPNDLSGSMGIPGHVQAPEMKEIYKRAAKILEKSGKPFGVATFYEEEWLRFWGDIGATMFFCGCDYSFLYSGVSDMIKGVKNVFEK